MRRTEEEILQGYQKDLGTGLGKQFFLLEKDFMVLKLYLKYLVHLFTEESSLNAINQSDKLFFTLVRTSMVQHVVIGIGKMLDKDSRSNKNLNLYLLGENNKELEGLIAAAREEYIGKFQKFRNKFFAHSDLRHRMGEMQLENFNFSELEEMIKHIERVFVSFYELNFASEKVYSGLIQSRNFDFLIRQIGDSGCLTKLERQAYKEGTVPHHILMKDADVALYSKKFFEIKSK